MNKLLKYAVLSFGMSISFLLLANTVEAAPVVQSITASPSGHRSLCGAGTPVDFSAYPSNVEFDTGAGVATYNVNVKWKRCDTSQTRAYAVYGNADICPNSGTYGIAPNYSVYDCVKYIGSPEYSDTSNLKCPSGQGVQCVTKNFAGVRVDADQPSTSATSRSIPITNTYGGSVPSSGTWTIAARMCQFYKIGANSDTINSTEQSKRCIDMSITITWANPVPGAQCQTFDGGFGIPAAATGQTIAVANTSGQIIANNQIKPGQQILLGVKFKNSGTTTWQPADGVHALVSVGSPPITIASAPAPYNTWSVDNAANPKRVYMQDGSVEIPPGGSVYFWFKVVLPAPLPDTNTITLTWRMRQTVSYGGSGPAAFGNTCSVKLNVAKNEPFIGIGGGDVISGSSFGSTSLGVSASCIPTKDSKNAGIATNGYYGNHLAVLRGFSRSQYAVFASGRIGDDNDYDNRNSFLGNFGYDRESIGITKDALFANLNVGINYGNYYNDIVNPPLPCFDIRPIQNKAVAIPSGATQSFLSGGDSGIRSVAASNVTIPATNIPGGTRKTLIVDGDVTISGNITYGNSYASVNGIPYLQIIANNIYIEVVAQRIDANLVAMPSRDPANSSKQINGIVDTCSNMGGTAAGAWPASLTITSCRRTPNSFMLNGKLVARRVLWKRTSGTLGFKAEAADPACYFGNYGYPEDAPIIVDMNDAVARTKMCSSEFINFNAESYLGSFNENTAIDPIPKNTIELPPIY